MPITPQQAADQRINSQITKLETLIDKKLTEHVGDFPFTFQFHRDTAPSVVSLIRDIYERVGWDAYITEEALKGSQENPDGGVAKVLTLRERGKGKESPAGDDIDSCVFENNGKRTTFIKGVKAAETITDTKPKAIRKTAQEDREEQLNEAFSEGNLARIRKSMVEPIRTTVVYQCNARKTLVHADEIYGKYTGITDNSLIWNGEKPVRYADLNNYPVTITKKTLLEAVGTNRCYKVDCLQVKAKDHIITWESEAAFGLLKAAVLQHSENTIHTYSETLVRALGDAFGEVDSQGVVTAKIFCHPQTYHRYIRALGKDDFDEGTMRDVIMTGVYGHFRTAGVHCEMSIPECEIYVLPGAQYLGALETAGGQEVGISLPRENADGTRMMMDLEHKFSAILINPQYVRRVKIRP